MKYYVHILGCAMNKSDAERVCSVLENMGYERTDTEAKAQLIGVLACSVRQSAIDRVYGKIHEWNKRKATGENLLTFVSGCVLPADAKKFNRLFDFVFGMDDVPHLPELLQQGGVTIPQAFWNINPSYASGFQAFVPIQNGCNKFCTYCAVPYTRGREVSRPSQDILAEVRRLIDHGYQRITLLGQNVNSYGLDREDELKFPGLMRAIGEMGGDVWVDYTSPHPRDMTKELLEVQATFPTLANLVHLPVQSGNNAVLKRMNRKYTVEQYMEWVERVRAYLPNVVLTTDAIVGFPGETEAQFMDTVEVFRKVKYDMAFTARYSPRPGALSEKQFTDDVPSQEKRRREMVLNEVLKKHSLARNETLVGSDIRVLVERTGKRGWMGRTEGQRPVVFSSDGKDLVGKKVEVRIESVTPFRLEGRHRTVLRKKKTAERVVERSAV